MRDMELGPEEKSLIAVARDSHAPTETQRARVRKALDTKLAAGMAAPLLATSSAMAMVGKVGAGVAILMVLGSTAAYVATSGPGHKAAAPQVRLRSTPARPPMAAPVPAPVPPTAVRPSAPTPNDSRPGAARPRVPSVRRAAGPAALPDLAGELALLTQISNATKRGDVAGAEHLLADYDRQFPLAQLAEERAATGILLECAAGRTASARAQARRFFEHWPRSPLVARINSSCIAEAKTP
jgi:hypothetical protein